MWAGRHLLPAWDTGERQDEAFTKRTQKKGKNAPEFESHKHDPQTATTKSLPERLERIWYAFQNNSDSTWQFFI